MSFLYPSHFSLEFITKFLQIIISYYIKSYKIYNIPYCFRLTHLHDNPRMSLILFYLLLQFPKPIWGSFTVIIQKCCVPTNIKYQTKSSGFTAGCHSVSKRDRISGSRNSVCLCIHMWDWPYTKIYFSWNRHRTDHNCRYITDTVYETGSRI